MQLLQGNDLARVFELKAPQGFLVGAVRCAIVLQLLVGIVAELVDNGRIAGPPLRGLGQILQHIALGFHGKPLLRICLVFHSKRATFSFPKRFLKVSLGLPIAQLNASLVHRLRLCVVSVRIQMGPV